jgi:hypothetical protein
LKWLVAANNKPGMHSEELLVWEKVGKTSGKRIEEVNLLSSF